MRDPGLTGLSGGEGHRTMADEFDDFVRMVRPRLLRAFVAGRGIDGAEEATAEALAWAWEHWSEVTDMENPAGYLFRVGQSRTRRRRSALLPAPAAIGVPNVEPNLVPSLLALPEKQRTAVWLVHACGWSYAEVAEAMSTSTTMVGNHVSRALARLRRALKVDRDA